MSNQELIERMRSLAQEMRQWLEQNSKEYRALIALETALEKGLGSETSTSDAFPRHETIADLVELVLRQEGQPCTVQTLIDRLQEHGKDLKRSSLSVTLSRNKRFRNIKEGPRRGWWIAEEQRRCG